MVVLIQEMYPYYSVVIHRYILTTEDAKHSEICKAIRKSKYETRSGHTWLAAYLCQEKYNPNSFWKPYIDTLPQTYDNIPIYFPELYKKMLKGSYSLEMAFNRKLDLRAEYEGLTQTCPLFRKYSFKDFMWGRLVLHYANNHLKLDMPSSTTNQIYPYF